MRKCYLFLDLLLHAESPSDWLSDDIFYNYSEFLHFLQYLHFQTLILYFLYNLDRLGTLTLKLYSFLFNSRGIIY